MNKNKIFFFFIAFILTFVAELTVASNKEIFCPQINEFSLKLKENLKKLIDLKDSDEAQNLKTLKEYFETCTTQTKDFENTFNKIDMPFFLLLSSWQTKQKAELLTIIDRTINNLKKAKEQIDRQNSITKNDRITIVNQTKQAYENLKKNITRSFFLKNPIYLKIGGGILASVFFILLATKGFSFSTRLLFSFIKKAPAPLQNKSIGKLHITTSFAPSNL